MIDIKEAQKLTYKESKWTQKLKRKIDRKIKRATRHGKASTFIYVPQFSGEIDVFLSITKEYEDIGYKVREYCTKETQNETIFWGVWISWEK